MFWTILILISLTCAQEEESRGKEIIDLSFHARDVPIIPPRKSDIQKSSTDATPVEQTPPPAPKPPYVFPDANASLVSNNSFLLNSNAQKSNETSVPSVATVIAQDAYVTKPSDGDKQSFIPVQNVTLVPLKPTDTEVSDLLKIPTEISNDTDLKPVKPKIIYALNKNDHIDDSVEPIDNGENTEDVRVQQRPAQEEGVALIQGQLAAVLAGVFVAIAVIGYIGLISWRKHLESRYSDRQMLVNEIEFNEREDSLQFTI